MLHLRCIFFAGTYMVVELYFVVFSTVDAVSAVLMESNELLAVF